jgi:aryl-alcohol dehydrogenase-like predicted oxidoreductase
MPRMAFLLKDLTDKAKNEAVGKLDAIAKDLGCTLAQLSLAWCAKNPHVSTVITGASRPAQVKENMKASR